MKLDEFGTRERFIFIGMRKIILTLIIMGKRIRGGNVEFHDDE
jgi:hypothetical protein